MPTVQLGSLEESTKPLLQVEHLTKNFPLVVANDAVNIDIMRGEIHCLLGENGAGKSTLAECLFGFLTPDSGKIFFKGQEVKLTSPHSAIQLGIGMVHQHFVLVPPMSVLENIVVGTPSTAFILDYTIAEKRINQLCKDYNISLDIHAKVWQLSVGEQQWVEILKALYTGVELLILDEPTAVLTPQESQKLFSILQKMKSDGLSILFITHKLKEVMAVSDRVTVLRKGKLVGTVDTCRIRMDELAKMMVGREVFFNIHKEFLPPGEPILEITDLHANNDRGLEALRGVNLTIHRNEILGIAGVSGNGQKELFEIIVGVRNPTHGHVFLEKKDITGESPKKIMRKGLGHVPEDRIKEGLIPEFTIEENLILGLQRRPNFLRGILLDLGQVRKHAQDCIHRFEIATPSTGQITRTLSGGNLQKVILARELSQEPICLIANQPTRGLDVGAIEYVHCRLMEQRQGGMGILLFSEDLDEIFKLADRVAVIYKGSIQGIFNIEAADISTLGLLMAGGEEKDK